MSVIVSNEQFVTYYGIVHTYHSMRKTIGHFQITMNCTHTFICILLQKAIMQKNTAINCLEHAAKLDQFI